MPICAERLPSRDCDAQPQNYWSNTSSNDVVKQFVQKADKGPTKREIEKLVAGEIITKEIHQELTYKDMYDSIDTMWSVLFTTSYLTQRGRGRRIKFIWQFQTWKSGGFLQHRSWSYLKGMFKRTVLL